MPGFYRNWPPMEMNFRARGTLLKFHQFVLASNVLEVYRSTGLGTTFAGGSLIVWRVAQAIGWFVPAAGIDK
jgi:hypothetical protein